jgi:hypothetical protein
VPATLVQSPTPGYNGPREPWSVNLIVFHYHFLTGGVTTVIRQALRAIRRHLPEVGGVELVGGRADPRLAEELAAENVSVHSLPAVDYREGATGNRRQTAQAAAGLASELRKRFGGAEVVWWIHNHHLGKNPVLTQALLALLAGGTGQRTILQIHDFPEAGRPANLRRLGRTVGLPLYPVGANVRYAVLTPRDRSVLLEAGIPAESLFLLGNPVPPVAPPADGLSPEPAVLRRTLAGAFGSEFPGFDPGRPLAIYPVRTIRRKNVLEACLLCRLPKDPLALLVTLPGVSAAERPYSDRVEAAFRSRACGGLWGIGPRLGAAGLGFQRLVEGSDLVISSAVQEGFGYLFANSLQWRRPLVARKLEILEGTEDLFAGYPAQFYPSVSCPLGAPGRAWLRSAYRRKLSRLSALLPVELRAQLEQEVERRFASEPVEYSYLSVAQQEALLARFSDAGLAAELRRLNQGLVQGIPEVTRRPVPDRSAAVDERFGLQPYALRFRAILDSFASPPPGANPDPGSIQSRVLQRFARLEHLRLLHD